MFSLSSNSLLRHQVLCASVPITQKGMIVNNIPGRSFQTLFLVAITASLLSFWGDNLFADEAVKKKEKVQPVQSRLIIMDANGSNVKELFRSEKFTAIGSPDFSPDGKQIAFDGWDEPGGEKNWQAHLLIVNADGTDLKDVGHGAMPTWSPDGKQFAFSSYSPRGIWTMNIDGTNRELIDPAGWGAQWSPDGTMIIYSDSSLGETNLKIYHTKEETFRYVFPFGKSPYRQYYWNSCWAPDSKSLCFKGRTKEGVYEIVTLEIDKGLKGLKIHYSDSKIQPAADYSWHPDGKQISYRLWSQKDKAAKIFSLNPMSDEKPTIIPGQKYDVVPLSLSWRRDGKKLVFIGKPFIRK